MNKDRMTRRDQVAIVVGVVFGVALAILLNSFDFLTIFSLFWGVVFGLYTGFWTARTQAMVQIHKMVTTKIVRLLKDVKIGFIPVSKKVIKKLFEFFVFAGAYGGVTWLTISYTIYFHKYIELAFSENPILIKHASVSIVVSVVMIIVMIFAMFLEPLTEGDKNEHSAISFDLENLIHFLLTTAIQVGLVFLGGVLFYLFVLAIVFALAYGAILLVFQLVLLASEKESRAVTVGIVSGVIGGVWIGGFDSLWAILIGAGLGLVVGKSSFYLGQLNNFQKVYAKMLRFSMKFFDLFPEDKRIRS